MLHMKATETEHTHTPRRFAGNSSNKCSNAAHIWQAGTYRDARECGSLTTVKVRISPYLSNSGRSSSSVVRKSRLEK